MPDSAFTEPNSFVPEETKPTDAINLPAAKQNEAEKLRLERLNYRKAKTVVIKDAAIRSLLDQADKAQNDGDRRAAFRKYYELLDKKITKMDPSVAEYSTTMRKAQFGRLQEDRVEPTIPNNPPPTPEPAR
ncbi:MAG: hypothetical protein ABIP97_06690 [Chthoniobacterales bacterium]